MPKSKSKGSNRRAPTDKRTDSHTDATKCIMCLGTRSIKTTNNIISLSRIAFSAVFSSILAKQLAGKSISDMTYLVSSGTLNLNLICQSIQCSDTAHYAPRLHYGALSNAVICLSVCPSHADSSILTSYLGTNTHLVLPSILDIRYKRRWLASHMCYVNCRHRTAISRRHVVLPTSGLYRVGKKAAR